MEPVVSERGSRPAVTNNPEARRYECRTDHGLALLEYVIDGTRIEYVHTEVPPESEGRGVGAALVRTALDEARAQDLRVVPTCPFVRAWIERHPDYHALVTTH
jgi:uncharacterized protein